MQIERISEKAVNTRYGAKTTYSVCSDGVWYKMGFTKPTFKEGAVLKNVRVEEGKYGKELISFEVESEGNGAKAAPPARAYGGGAQRVFPIPPLHGDRAIVRQNSLTNAVNLLRETGALKSAKDDADMIVRAIAMARQFEAYSCGDLDAAEAKSRMEQKSD